MASSEQLEREAEATRARIEETLAELRTRISPGGIVDQAIDYARETGGGDFVRHLGRQVTDNPLPVALMGAGLAWLMMAPRRRSNGDAGTKGDGSVATTEPVSFNAWSRTVAMATDFEKTSRGAAKKKAQTAADQAVDAGSEAAKGAYEVGSGAAADAADKSASTAARAYDKAQELAGGAYERARDVAGRTMSSARQGTRGVTRFMQDEPLVVAGLGIALGALVGALLPPTELENRTMGETSDRLKREAREAAREQWERGKEIAEDGWDEAKEAARRTWEDAKAEAQKSWENAKRDAALGEHSDGHAADMTGAEIPLVPSEEETKSRRRPQARGQEVQSSS